MLVQICRAFFNGLQMLDIVKGFFFAIAQNGQISKFTKCGHVVYNLICFLKLIDKTSQIIPTMHVQPIINNGNAHQEGQLVK